MIQVASGDRPLREHGASTTVLHVEQVACQVCGQSACRRLFTERYQFGGQQVWLGINRCLECGQIYVSPRLDEQSVAAVYRWDAARTISHHYCWSDESSDTRFQPLLNRLARRAPDGRLLDVGCGNGSFLAAAARHGRWQLWGVEPVEVAAVAAQSRVNGKILNSTLESAALPAQSFDAITLLGVLEHLPAPATTLDQVHGLLRPNGYLAVYVPNYYYLRLKDTGPACWLSRRTWSHLAPQEHLFHFTPTLLRRLMKRSGFQLDRIDVGRPFLGASSAGRLLKQTAFVATSALHRLTGLHLGGLEVIARKQAKETQP